MYRRKPRFSANYLAIINGLNVNPVPEQLGPREDERRRLHAQLEMAELKRSHPRLRLRWGRGMRASWE